MTPKLFVPPKDITDFWDKKHEQDMRALEQNGEFKCKPRNY